MAKEYEPKSGEALTDTVKTSTLGLEFYARLTFEILWIDAF
jgi:hypothetical protein